MHGQRQTHLDVAAAERRGLVGDGSTEVWLADWKRHGLPYCSVYIITPDSEWPCKIGISTHAHKRLVGLQTAVWRPLRVARCYWTPTVHEARQVEKKMHETLSDMGVWMHGEWFDMKPKKAAELVEFTALTLGVEVSERITDPSVIETVYARVSSVYTCPPKMKKRLDDMWSANIG